MLEAGKKRLIKDSLRALAASHAAAVAQIEETMAVLSGALELDDPGDGGEPGHKASRRPVADVTTFNVVWRGKTCFLGNTLLFWLFARLARTPNHYVAHADLLEEVWRAKRESSTIRGVAKRLRDRLVDSDMADLASAIDGSVTGYFGLKLV